MRKTFVVLVLLVLAGGYASAQTTDETRKAAAAALVKLCMPKAQYESMIQTMSTQMGSKMVEDMNKKGLNPPSDFAERMSRTMLEVMPYDEQLELATEAYANNFTLDEINAMAGFYQTPVGQKVLSMQPKIMGETMQKLMARVGDRLPAAMERNGLIPKPEENSAPAAHASSKPETAPTK